MSEGDQYVRDIEVARTHLQMASSLLQDAALASVTRGEKAQAGVLAAYSGQANYLKESIEAVQDVLR